MDDATRPAARLLLVLNRGRVSTIATGDRPYSDVLDDLPAFIEEVYNTKRLHFALGYLSPLNFEEAHARPLVETED